MSLDLTVVFLTFWEVLTLFFRVKTEARSCLVRFAQQLRKLLHPKIFLNLEKEGSETLYGSPALWGKSRACPILLGSRGESSLRGIVCFLTSESPAPLQGLAQEVLDKYYWANAETLSSQTGHTPGKAIPKNPICSVIGEPKVAAAQAGGVPKRRAKILKDLGH